MDVYGDDPCTIFKPKSNEDEPLPPKQARLIAQMHKAITMIQFKLEAKIIDRRPEFEMSDRKQLEYIDFTKGVIILNGKEYHLKDRDFQTIDQNDPYKLTQDAEDDRKKLTQCFKTRSR